MAAPASGWWRVCPGCGCKRQLDRAAAAAGREQMTVHNRFDVARGAMVRCAGSGQPPSGGAASGGGRGEGDGEAACGERPPGGTAGGRQNLAQANAAKVAAAGSHNAALARQALEVLGDSCPQPLLEVAQLRIASPAASWAQIAAAVPAGDGRVNKSVVAGRFRRLLVAADLLGQSASGGGRGEGDAA